MAIEHNYCEKRIYENGGCNEVRDPYADGILHFLRRLSPGTCIVLQYDSQPPTTGTFQGFQNGTVILSDFECFPGLAHLALHKINVIALGSLSNPHPRERRECNCQEL